MSSKENPKKSLLPKLRFPEFREEGYWEMRKLGEISDIRDGTHDSPKFYSSGYPLVTSKNLLPNGLLDLKNVNLVSEKDYKNINKRSKVDEGDILFGMIGTIGNPVLLKTTGFSIKNVALIKQKTNLLNCYLVHFLNSEYIAATFYALNTGNTQKFIALGQIRNLELPTPSLREQKKIANCLSSLDELIVAEGQKLEAIKEYKKGLMQQLFPTEGETVAKLRFPEFRDAGDWEKTCLRKMNLDIGDGNYSAKYPSQSDFLKTGTPFLRANNLKNGSVVDEDLRFISQQQHNILMKGHLKKGDILISTRGELGKVAIVPDRHVGSNINAQLVRINTGEKLNNTFLFELLTFYKESGVFDIISTGTALKQLPINKLNLLELKIPTILQEQQKIAGCLFSLDNLIIGQCQKIEALKGLKKGLMQQLFPIIREV
jgi:type I restriction enzyme S subunit